MVKYQANYDFHTEQRRHMVRYGLNDPRMTLREAMGYSVLAMAFLLLLLI